MTRRTYLGSLGSLVSLILTLTKVSSSYSQSLDTSSQSSVPMTSLHDLERRSRLLKTEDYASIDSLTRSVLSVPRYFNMPDYVLPVLSPRLSAAEQSHLRHTHPGVHEDDLADFFNNTATKVNAPKFAFTTSHQLRVLRVGALRVNPVFMGRGMTSANAKVGDSINPRMSPLQATHLVLLMADQKALNPEYQLEPDEWNARHESKKIQANKQTSPDQKDLHRAVSMRNNSKRRELTASLTAGMQNLSAEDGVNMAYQAMSQFGI